MRDDERMRRADEQERRALEALGSISRGGDLGAETLALSNEFTDRQTARFGAWLRRLGRRRLGNPAARDERADGERAHHERGHPDRAQHDPAHPDRAQHDPAHPDRAQHDQAHPDRAKYEPGHTDRPQHDEDTR
ncbi:hypothetical protein [Herbiconiux sp. A18JL235]|uniref:Uncharacterized protein n=1 Tax=Herbiconiux sp. A18JL235 TaxID=3152363 RepID=A0AB39BKM2_9MICO